jgi:hypothetical protein
MADHKSAEASPTVAGMGRPRGCPESNWSAPNNGGSWGPLGGADEPMAFFISAQKSVRVLSSAVKAGAPPKKKNETMVAAMAAQKVAAMSPLEGGCCSIPL